MANDQDMSGWTDLLHSSTKLLEQAAPSSQFPPLQRNLDQLEVLSKMLKAKTLRTEAPTQSIAATRLLAREGINAEQLARDLKPFELKYHGPPLNKEFPYLIKSFLMEATDWESSSGGGSGDDDIYEQDIKDEEECLCASEYLRKLQFRKRASTARWNDQLGMTEILENKGSLWTTTGIVRCGMIYCSIEETLYLIEVGALHLLDHDNSSLSLKDVYKKVAEGKSGCVWEQFEVYRHLKSLGFIVGKHKVPWSVKGVRNGNDISFRSSVENKGSLDCESEDEWSISKLLNAIQLDEVTPIFDVFLPHSKFRKSSPGDPNLMVCLSRGYPPPKKDVEVLERISGGIPIKYCHVEHGRVCFFSFDKVELPVLP